MYKSFMRLYRTLFAYTVKPALGGHPKGLEGKWKLTEDQMCCRMLFEHSAILLACINKGVRSFSILGGGKQARPTSILGGGGVQSV